MSKEYLAIDIGASSGRAIIGTVNNSIISLKETARFENALIHKNGHLCWDIHALKENVIDAITSTVRQGHHPACIGIDTWAVDYVLLDKDDHILGDAVGYRDNRTDGIGEELEEKGILSKEETYSHTGIQYQKFNTIYQLCALKKENPEYIEKAETFLMIPDYLNYVLTGVKANEYTNATTTSLVNCFDDKWDSYLLDKTGIPSHIFQTIHKPGTLLGTIRKEIAERTGLDPDTKVILPATHDTGSAFLAVPAEDDHSVFLSSGTWSLMGVENKKPIISTESRKANFTNEGGYQHRFRYLKNIMGLWMIQNVRKELGEITGSKPSFPELIKEAEKYHDLKISVNVDDPSFLAPDSMIQAVLETCRKQNTPVTDDAGAVLQVIYNSLSKDYAETIRQLESLTSRKYTSINIVGGGSQDNYLNQKTADASGLTVYAGPVEGTALGNLIVQFIYDGIFTDLFEARNAVKNSFEIKTFKPRKQN